MQNSYRFDEKMRELVYIQWMSQFLEKSSNWRNYTA